MRQFLAQCAAGIAASGSWLRSRLGAAARVVTRRPAASAAVVTMLAVVALGAASSAHAQADIFTAEGITTVLSGILEFINNFFGRLLAEITDAVITVSQYNNFTSSTVVVRGWVIMRDVVNMAFIAMMLYIAFMTMFGRDDHPIQSIVKLMMGAIVINFSRTVMGLAIDLSQVVMLTFVNGIKDAAGGNFIELFQIQEVLKPTFDNGAGVGEIFAVHLLAFVMLVVAIITMITLLVFLVIRIVYLWILTIMSPLAFFGYFSPAKAFQGVWGQWWTQFVKQLKSGPILAFFLWLALLTVQATNGDLLENQAGQAASSDVNFLPGNVEVNLQTYVVGIILILKGMEYALENGGDSFKTAKKLVDKGVSKAQGYLSKGGKKVWSGTKTAGKAAVLGAGGLALGLADKASGFRVAQRDAQGRYQFSPNFQGTRVSDLAAITAKKVKTGLGMTKEAQAMKAAEDEITLMKRRGANAQDIDKKEGELRGKISTELLRKYSPEKLGDMVMSGKLKGREAEAAVMALAKKKYGGFYGQGEGVSEALDKAFGGKVSKDLEYAVRSELKTAGDARAFTGFDEDTRERVDNKAKVTEKFEFANPQELATELKDVAKGVMPTAYADASDRYAVDKLLKINKDTFEEMRSEPKRYKGTIKEVERGLTNALAMATYRGDASLQKDLLKQMDDLGMVERMDAAQQQLFVNDQDAFIRQAIEDKKSSSSSKYVSIADTAMGKVAGARIKAVKQGVDFSHAFSGFRDDGMAKNTRAFSELAGALEKKENALALAKNIDPNTLNDYGGRNAAAIALLSNLNEDDMMKMAAEGQSDAVISLLQASGNISSTNATELAQQYDAEVIAKDAALKDDVARNAAFTAYEERAKKAVENAKTIQGMRDAIAKNVTAKITRAAATVGNVVLSPLALTASAVGAVYAAPTIASVIGTVTAPVGGAGVAGVGLAGGVGAASAVDSGARRLASSPTTRSIGRATRAFFRNIPGAV